MNYRGIYDCLIKNRRAQPTPEGYTENHHILPKALGGNNGADNLIRLTPEDHFIAHRLLAKIHGGSMYAALWMMCHPRGDAKEISVSRLVHGHARRAFAERVSETMKGRIFSEESLRRMSEAQKGRKLTEAQRKKLSEAHKGQKPTAEMRKRISERMSGERHPLYGTKRSPETLRKMSESKRGERHNNYGKTFPPEQKQRMSDARGVKPEYVFKHAEHGEVTMTPYQLRVAFGLDGSHIRDLASGKRKKHNGWVCLGIAKQVAA